MQVWVKLRVTEPNKRWPTDPRSETLLELFRNPSSTERGRGREKSKEEEDDEEGFGSE